MACLKVYFIGWSYGLVCGVWLVLWISNMDYGEEGRFLLITLRMAPPSTSQSPTPSMPPPLTLQYFSLTHPWIFNAELNVCMQ